jgi:mannonate dehydratase
MAWSGRRVSNLHLGLSMSNFGIQEWYGPTDRLREVFPGTPEVRQGYMYPNDLPGLGVDINEEMAAKYPCKNENPEWTLARLPDGTSARP